LDKEEIKKLVQETLESVGQDSFNDEDFDKLH
jgi:hypothetical protein